MKLNLFGTIINVKDNQCSLNGKKGNKVNSPYVNMYVVLTNKCNASCAFCCNEKNVNKDIKFNFYKFYYVIHEIQKRAAINKLSFTGGEPSLTFDLLTQCVKAVKDLDSEIFTIINTNGFNLEALADISGYFDSFAISHHHYNDEINNRIFGTNSIAYSRRIKDFPKKDKIHLSCNLQKGYIDSAEQVKIYLEDAATLGISDIGFVSLIPVNEYCKDHFIDFTDIDFDSIDNLYISKEWNNDKYCRCRNYLYLPESSNSKIDIVKMYTRYYVDPSYCTSTLVFDGEYLREGFNGNIII